METYRVKTTITKGHSLSLKELPFAEGEKVEVIVRRQKAGKKAEERYSLRGKPIRYVDPFGSVAETDWEVLK